jgi:hypothetical protein
MANIERGAVPPYGPPIHEAIAKGDLAHMKQLAAQTETFLQESGDVAGALELLRIEIAKHEYKSKGKH